MKNETLLFRQINPVWVQNDGVASMAFAANVKGIVQSGSFVPTKKDDDKLSVYNGEVFTAESSFKHFTTQNLKSAGVLGLTVSEFQAEGLPAVDDNVPFHGHASVDYSGCISKGERNRKGIKLREKALQRGWLYQPESEQKVQPEPESATEKEAEEILPSTNGKSAIETIPET